MHEIFSSFDIKMMQRCFQLACNGVGSVAPNPMVGCVVTNENIIIGEGYHQQYGEPHAEVRAINSVKNESLFKQATLYVNLEPCAHYGKTPPCADLIISKNIPRVVICNVDPYAKVSGKGIEKLEAAGCDVSQGLLKDEGWFLNRRFFTFHEKRRPWIILKWAESRDGYIDLTRETKDKDAPQWLTNQTAKHLVHKWRAQEQAILVGGNTAVLDNPKLNVREWFGKNPMRVLIDFNLNVSSEAQILDGSQPTLVFNEKMSKKEGNTEYIKLSTDNNMPREVIHELFLRDIQSVIIEGGAFVLSSFIQIGLWDEIQRFIGEKYLIDGVSAPLFRGIPDAEFFIGNSLLETFYNY